MTSPTIKELREAYNFDIKKETKKYAMVGYQQGYTNALHCVKKGLFELIGKETEPPIKIEDIVVLVDKWYKDAEKELEKVKKEQEWYND